jgi:hypothetical protein
MSLSKTQANRLGGLLAVMSNDTVPENLISESIDSGYVVPVDGRLRLSDKGVDEKNRLCTLAGLNIKYSSERAKEK